MIVQRTMFVFCALVTTAASATQMSVPKQKEIAFQYPASQLDLQLLQAVRENRLQEVVQFVELGAQVQAQDAHGWTALMEAAERGYCDIAEFLIQRGSLINVQSSGGKTALMCAARIGHVDCVRLLISSGAYRDVQDELGRTALMYASRDENPEKRPQYLTIVKMLIRAKAKLNIQNNSGQTALMYAVWHHNDTIAQTLIKAWAHDGIVDHAGRTYETMRKEKSQQVSDIREYAEGVQFTFHAREQMKTRVIFPEDVLWVLKFGKVYRDDRGLLKVAHQDKDVGVIFNPKNNTVVTVISFINKDELQRWLSKEKTIDVLSWLKSRIDINQVPYRQEKMNRPHHAQKTDAAMDDIDDDGYDASEEELIKRFSLEPYVYGYDEKGL